MSQSIVVVTNHTALCVIIPLSRFRSSHHVWFSEMSGSHGILLTRGPCQAWLCDPLLGWLAWCWAVGFVVVSLQPSLVGNPRGTLAPKVICQLALHMQECHKEGYLLAQENNRYCQPLGGSCHGKTVGKPGLHDVRLPCIWPVRGAAERFHTGN